jgi:hypothetical protein
MLCTVRARLQKLRDCQLLRPRVLLDCESPPATCCGKKPARANRYARYVRSLTTYYSRIIVLIMSNRYSLCTLCALARYGGGGGNPLGREGALLYAFTASAEAKALTISDDWYRCSYRASV